MTPGRNPAWACSRIRTRDNPNRRRCPRGRPSTLSRLRTRVALASRGWRRRSARAAARSAFLTRSTATSDKTIEWEDGNTYPVVDVEISNVSHPFYTGTARVLDTAGRVERFERRYSKREAN
ncbi:ribosomal protein L31 [Streptomyces sp. SLBN-118]|nr:ribosomal protein L31 [Streptomyces sp. SLBN-118]